MKRIESARLTVVVGPGERRWLIEEAARRAIERCAPVSISGVLRDLVVQARDQDPRGPQRAA